MAVPRRTGRTLPCLVATWVGWGSTYLAIKFALISFPPFFQVGSRFLMAGGLLMGWAWWRGLPMPTATQWRNACVIGTVMLGGTVAGATFAEQSVASGLVVTFMAVTPALLALGNLLCGITPSRLELTGIACGFAGVLLLARGTSFSASPQGLIAVVIAVLSFSLGSILSRRTFPLAPGFPGYASGLVCAGLLLLALAALAEEAPAWPPQPVALAAWWYLVLVGSVIAFSAYMTLLATTSTALASSWTFVAPLVGTLLGTSLGGESVTTTEWTAIGVIILGVTMLVLGREDRAARGRCHK